MLSCKEVSKLVSESLDRKLSLWQRISLWMHFFMCGFCWRFRKDLIHLHDETHEHATEIENEATDLEVTLPDDSRDRMKRLIESQL